MSFDKASQRKALARQMPAFMNSFKIIMSFHKMRGNRTKRDLETQFSVIVAAYQRGMINNKKSHSANTEQLSLRKTNYFLSVS